MATHSGIKDEGAVFQIVPTTRKIVVPASHKIVGTVGDHNSEQLTFQCPKTIDGHDILGCSDKYVSWQAANGDEGSFSITNMKAEGENVIFTWTLDCGVTVAEGNISFSVHFEDKSETGELLYHWGTTSCNDCQILNTHKRVSQSKPNVPDGFVQPYGTLNITDLTYNGQTIDISQYKSLYLNIPTFDDNWGA